MFLESFDTIKQKVSYKDESGYLSLKVGSSRASLCSHTITIHNSSSVAKWKLFNQMKVTQHRIYDECTDTHNTEKEECSII